jgi:hypothetical protein
MASASVSWQARHSMLLTSDEAPAALYAIEGANLDTMDVAELDLPDSRVINLAHLAKWAIANGY